MDSSKPILKPATVNMQADGTSCAMLLSSTPNKNKQYGQGYRQLATAARGRRQQGVPSMLMRSSLSAMPPSRVARLSSGAVGGCQRRSGAFLGSPDVWRGAGSACTGVSGSTGAGSAPEAAHKPGQCRLCQRLICLHQAYAGELQR